MRDNPLWVSSKIFSKNNEGNHLKSTLLVVKFLLDRIRRLDS